MTITDSTTALATRDARELSDDQLKRRLQLSRGAGYGLQQATPAQLEVVFLLCQRYKLDPLTDLTLYEGRPWITIDGRVRLMRRHPEYRGYDCQPLTAAQKEAWGYEADDIVVECTVRTTTWGDIKARGKVSRAEFEGKQPRSNPVAKVHPVEMAEKRAIARAERAAFGQDAVLDEEDAEIQIIEQEQRNTPERRAALAAKHDSIWGADEDTAFAEIPQSAQTRPAAPPPPSGQQGVSAPPEGVQPTSSEPAAEDTIMVKSVRHPLCQELAGLHEQAAALGIDVAPYVQGTPAPASLFAGKISALTDAILRAEDSQAAPPSEQTES